MNTTNKNRLNRIGEPLIGLCKAFLIPVLLYCILLIFIGNRLGNWNSIKTILVMAIVPTIAAYGLSFGFTSGIMDFSVGSLMLLSGMCSAVAGHYLGFFGMLIGAILTAVFLGFIVGGLYAMLKIPSLVVSLGALMVFEISGKAMTVQLGNIAPNLSTGQYIKTPNNLTFLGAPPYNFIILIVVALLYHIIYYRTEFSTRARMVGSDELIAKNIGIRPMKVKFKTFLIGGIFLGIAAMVSACYSSAIGYKVEMASISMVFKPMMAVIVGISLERFVKMPVGIFIGSLCISILFTGIIALGWPDSLQNVLLGLFMLIVLSIPTVQKKTLDSRRRRKVKRAFQNGNIESGV